MTSPDTKRNDTGATLWFTGLSGSGKTTLSQKLAAELVAMGKRVEVLDGDLIRTHLCRDLAFSREDRRENVRRLGFLCKLLSRNGVIAVVAAISPYRADRQEVRTSVTNFVEIYIECSLEVLIQRDAKGLYKKALNGEIAHFTGISDPYEPPLSPEIRIDSTVETIEQSFAHIMERLVELGVATVA